MTFKSASIAPGVGCPKWRTLFLTLLIVSRSVGLARAEQTGELAGLKTTLSPAAVPQFQSGDQWAATGDSITHTGFYTRYIYLFYATRFPDRAIDFFNCGSAGDTAKGTLMRLDKDILRHKPTVATIMLGMNDVRRSLYGSKFAAPDKLAQQNSALNVHFASMRTLADKLQTAGVRMIFITPSIFDETATWGNERSPGVNAALGRSAENTIKLATEFSSPFVDFHGPMTRLNLEIQKSDPKSSLIGPDRIHPKEKGGLVMAYLFLKAQGISPYVDDIAEDAAGKSEMSFTRKAGALPFPVPAGCEDALKLVPFTEELNQERLRVANLQAGNYQLSIDDLPVASFTSDQLRKGINLATLSNTPESIQAREVEKLDAKRYELVQGLRTIDFYERSLNPNFGTRKAFDWQAALAKRPKPSNAWATKNRESYLKYKPREAELRKELDDLVLQIRKASQPQPHTFILKKE